MIILPQVFLGGKRRSIIAVVRPFRCVRPDASTASLAAALPYDVYNRKGACEAVTGEPLSFLNIDRVETQFPEDVDTYDDKVYEKAAELLELRITDGTFVSDIKECYYIYQLTMDGRNQTGIAARSSIDDHQNGVVKKHENTREDKELDRIRHVDTTNVHTSPILLTYRGNEALAWLVEYVTAGTPLYGLVANDGAGHRVWRVGDDETIRQMEAAFLEIPATYIVDGHHRAASAVKVGLRRGAENPDYMGDEEFNYFLSVLFPDDQLMIMPYNWVVTDLDGLGEEEFLVAVEEIFEVEFAGDRVVAPDKKGTLGIYLGGGWYRLTVKPERMSDDPVGGLDVSVLQNDLLPPTLGTGDPRTDKRTDFIGGIRRLKELERRVVIDMMVAFSVYPTSIKELFWVADTRRLMSSKFTWLEPKLRNGLFIHKLS